MTRLAIRGLFPVCVLAAASAAGSVASAAPTARAIQPTTGAIRAARVFDEPLAPLGAQPSAEENLALEQAIDAYGKAGKGEDTQPFERFLKAHPASPWRASLLTNLGIVYRHTGYFTKALDAWEQAWALTKGDRSAEGTAVGSRAVSELIELNARVGRMDQLKALFGEIEHYPMAGSSAAKAGQIREGLWIMEHTPEVAFRCGPMALASILKTRQGETANTEALEACHSTQKGTSLLQNLTWANTTAHLEMQAAKRQPGAPVLLPALVHWKAGHYAALLREYQGRYLLKDPTFGGEFWVSRKALDEESSGYALVAKGNLPKGWHPVTESEAGQVWGMGTTTGTEKEHTFPCKPCDKGGPGMPVYSLDAGTAGLCIEDTPVGYAPPRGYAVNFHLTFFSNNTRQPVTFSYGNVGHYWTHDWFSYLTDDPSNQAQTVTWYDELGDDQPFTYNTATQTFNTQWKTRSVLTRTGTSSYTLQHPDGSTEIFDLPDNGYAVPRRLFRTKRIDPAGNTLTFVYDAQRRLVAVNDALGRSSTLSYELPSDPLKITRVTDPFGRSAQLAYDANGNLASITDAIGMTSTFTNGFGSFGPTSLSMITPYGTTAFSLGGTDLGTAWPPYIAQSGSVPVNHWVTATDPQGNQEYLLYLGYTAGMSPTDPAVPPGVINNYLYYRNVYFWDKRAMAASPGDFGSAALYHFLHDKDNSSLMSGTLESVKKPLESRIWYLYPGQAYSYVTGTMPSPSKKMRVLDDGSTQSIAYTYNDLGKVLTATDPVGRVTTNVYSADGIDLLEVRNTTGGASDLLAKYTYNGQHKPLTALDAAGQTTSFSYNSWGQLQTVTNPKSETTTLTYDGQGFLSSVSGPVTGTTTGFTYDAVGRVHTTTSPDGDTVTTDFDALDRPTKVTYPDATFEQKVYDRLDVSASRDRKGNWTFMSYNALRQLMEVRDAQGRVTTLSWCGCGSQLEGLVDPMGHSTTWLRDLEGHVIAKIYDDTSLTAYAYDGESRLVQRTDPKGQITHYAYNPDDTLLRVSYEKGDHATPMVSYTYDARYNRLATMLDGTGTTSYAYNPVAVPPALGAGRLATVISVAFPNGDITYGYDELGRVTSRAINGVAETRVYDALGRISQVTNPLGQFTYTYDGVTSRLLNIAYPNGQSAAFSYFDGTGSRRLREIKNQKGDGTPISIFDYTYDANGQIQTWSQQADVAAPKTYTFQYDAVGQVLGALLTDSTGAIVHQYAYGYDQAGNRVSEQIDNLTTSADYNDLNQLTHQRSSTNSMAGVAQPRGGSQAKRTPGKGAGKSANSSKARPSGAKATIHPKAHQG